MPSSAGSTPPAARSMTGSPLATTDGRPPSMKPTPPPHPRPHPFERQLSQLSALAAACVAPAAEAASESPAASQRSATTAPARRSRSRPSHPRLPSEMIPLRSHSMGCSLAAAQPAAPPEAQPEAQPEAKPEPAAASASACSSPSANPSPSSSGPMSLSPPGSEAFLSPSWPRGTGNDGDDPAAHRALYLKQRMLRVNGSLSYEVDAKTRLADILRETSRSYDVDAASFLGPPALPAAEASPHGVPTPPRTPASPADGAAPAAAAPAAAMPSGRESRQASACHGPDRLPTPSTPSTPGDDLRCWPPPPPAPLMKAMSTASAPLPHLAGARPPAPGVHRPVARSAPEAARCAISLAGAMCPNVVSLRLLDFRRHASGGTGTPPGVAPASQMGFRVSFRTQRIVTDVAPMAAHRQTPWTWLMTYHALIFDVIKIDLCPKKRGTPVGRARLRLRTALRDALVALQAQNARPASVGGQSASGDGASGRSSSLSSSQSGSVRQPHASIIQTELCIPVLRYQCQRGLHLGDVRVQLTFIRDTQRPYFSLRQCYAQEGSAPEMPVRAQSEPLPGLAGAAEKGSAAARPSPLPSQLQSQVQRFCRDLGEVTASASASASALGHPVSDARCMQSPTAESPLTGVDDDLCSPPTELPPQWGEDVARALVETAEADIRHGGDGDADADAAQDAATWRALLAEYCNPSGLENESMGTPRSASGASLLGINLNPLTATGLRELVDLASVFLRQSWRVSTVEFARGFWVLVRYYGRYRRTPLTDRVVRDARPIKIHNYFLRYAIAAYPTLLINYCGYGRGFLRDMLRHKADAKTTREYLGIKKEDMLDWGYTGTHIFKPNYFVVHDRHVNAIVVAIRGSFTVQDIIVDLCSEYEPFKNGSIHRGMLRCAEWLDEHCFDNVCRWIRERGVKALYLVGHSLGAGTGAVLTMLWSSRLAQLSPDGNPASLDFHCYNVATPGVADEAVATDPQWRSLMTTYVNENDIVSRLSYGSIQDFRELLHKAVELERDTAIPRGEKMQQLANFHYELTATNENAKGMIPGRVFYIYKTSRIETAYRPDYPPCHRAARDKHIQHVASSPYTAQMRSTPHPDPFISDPEPHYLIEESDARHFSDFAVRANACHHHFPDKYDNGMRKAYEWIERMSRRSPEASKG
ncbi:hypothetical protein CXG81DRAFT_23053 [Caulochytrium protostelioides]|uniref:sn-1-specific diacylglycerol lipase n=1 Tax=Caulochytrium protostelioides TaxID=1555241 RepID=A0A4P9XFC3_9FUNG|nr:hypothetical protein CXG81DRAFT_23053 [Caulochytrium protostelioides]|eukprot:RKP04277.1 hypothetical protein CXG81DRAFT_23053 [Caulochytrium protostelioides]